MILLKPLLPEDPDVLPAQKLNEEAFPDNERIDLSDLFRFNADGTMDILGIYAEGNFSGFLVMRKRAAIAYIAYFAVCADKRSQGIGSCALKALFEYYPDRQIIVDFESTSEESGNIVQRTRRRDFYLRNGFYETGWYQFYMETEFEIACSGPVFDKAGFEAMIADIHSRAPEFDPHLYRK